MKYYWNKEVQLKVKKLTKSKMVDLVLDLYDTANVNYCDETDTDRLKYIENIINKYIEIN